GCRAGGGGVGEVGVRDGKGLVLARVDVVSGVDVAHARRRTRRTDPSAQGIGPVPGDLSLLPHVTHERVGLIFPGARILGSAGGAATGIAVPAVHQGTNEPCARVLEISALELDARRVLGTSAFSRCRYME